VAKARSRSSFESTLATFPFISPRQAYLLSFIIPAAEGGLAVGILTNQAPIPFGIGASLLLVVFSLAVVGRYGWESSADCACFGQPVSLTGRRLVLRNAALSTLALVPAVLASDVSSLVLILTTGAAVAGLLIFLATVARLPHVHEHVAADPGRRLFLKSAASLAGAAVASAIGLLGSESAEAACGSCGSCADQYIFISCTGSCCAMYYVRRRKNCDGLCQGCTSWWTQEFCGVPGCGC
jgi:hypothetical protein